MNLKIDPEINIWLISLGILKPSRNDKTKLNQKIEIDQLSSK